MDYSIGEFDDLCKELGAKHAQLKVLDGEVKALKKKVSAVLMARDEDDRSHKAGGATFSMSIKPSCSVPKINSKGPIDPETGEPEWNGEEEKRKLMEYIRLTYPDWYKDQLTFNPRALTSLYKDEAEAAELREEEYEGMPGCKVYNSEGLSIRGAKVK